jgi:hypothetical protein
MDMEVILQMIVAKVPVAGAVLMALGGLVVVAQVYIALSPSKDDDALLQKAEGVPVLGALLKALKSFAPIQRKGE